MDFIQRLFNKAEETSRELPVHVMAELLEAIKEISLETSLPIAAEKAMGAVTEILNCDRASLFLVDRLTDELVLKVSSQVADIRIPSNVGIAGAVFETGIPLNIPNAYEDQRFDQSTDQKTGYQTKSILCLPIRDQNTSIIAILQAVNKKHPGNAQFIEFTPEDEVIAGHITSQLGVILRNMLLLDEVQREKRKVDAMLDIIRSLYSDMGINSILFTLTERTQQLVEADRCTMYIVDKYHQELMSMHGAVQIRIPITQGIAGEVATKNEIVNIVDAYQDPRFNPDVDKKSGYCTKTILCMPIRNSQNQVVGVLQIINKLNGVFTQDDVQLLQSFLNIVGSILSTSALYEQMKEEEKSEMEVAQDIRRKSSKSLKSLLPATVTEGDEEEGSDDDEHDS
jgi:adenylate cyclase